MKNQLFYDSMDQYKLSEQPGGGKQDVHVMENKFTVTRRLTSTPDVARRQHAGLGEPALRRTRPAIRYGGDFSSNRTDVDARRRFDDARTRRSSTRSTTPTLQRRRAVDEQLPNGVLEAGIGVLFDIDFLRTHELMLGDALRQVARRERRLRSTFNRRPARSSNPGAFRTADVGASGRDSGSVVERERVARSSRQHAAVRHRRRIEPHAREQQQQHGQRRDPERPHRRGAAAGAGV